MNDIFNKKYDKKESFSKKLLFQYISKPLGILENSIYSYSKKDNNIGNDPLLQLSIDFEEIEKIINSKNKEIVKYLYFYRFMLNKTLYDNDKIINIDDFFGKIADLSFHFYLCMIINYNLNVINYSISINYIRQINEMKENCNDKVYKKIILSKIILELIDAYKRSYDYFKNDKKELNEIENKAKIYLRTINLIDLNLNEKELISKKIDEIYIKIIISLIKNKKFEDHNYIYEVIKQLDLENIIITKEMFQQLFLLLNSEDKFINNYILIDINDLFDLKKVNFYYILFKYVLKNSIYIYQNDFFNKTRKTIIKIIKLKSNKLLSLREDYQNSEITSDLKEKIIYLIKAFTNSEYYYEQYINQNENRKENFINIGSNKIKDSILNLESHHNSDITTIIDNKNIHEPRLLFTKHGNMINYPDDVLEIIKIKDIIGKHLREAEFIAETKNGECISGGDNNELYLSNKQHQLISRFSLEDGDIYIKDSNILEEEKDIGKGAKVKKWSLSISELDYDEVKNELSFFECSKFGFTKVFINFKTEETNKVDISTISCSISFRISNIYIIAGEKGIFQFSLSNKNRLKEKDSKKGTYRGGIKLSDNYIVLTSNSSLQKGEDKLYLYDIKEKRVKIICKYNYSFTVSTNSLSIMDIESNKIILCGCKKYKKNQNNGILLVNIDKVYEEFLDTGDFEVYCLCPISETKEEKDKKVLTPTNYFFAGGFEQSKYKGMIKLFKIIKENKFYEIEYIQDIILNFSPFNKKMECLDNKKNSIFFTDFKRTISCIKQSQITGEIYVTSWDGFVYLFSPPNISYYLNEDKKEFYEVN